MDGVSVKDQAKLKVFIRDCKATLRTKRGQTIVRPPASIWTAGVKAQGILGEFMPEKHRS